MVHDELRKAREERGLSPAELGNKVGVRAAVLEAIDRAAYEELPTGLYGRHAVRAYAKAVGMDADRVLEEVGELLPKPENPLDGLARVRGFAPRRRRREEEPAADRAGVPGVGVSRADVHGAEAPDVEGPAACDGDGPPFEWRIPAASLIDGAILSAPLLILAKATAVAAGTDVADVIAFALPAWVLIAVLVSSAYFVLLGGVRNATFGAIIAGVRPEQCTGRRVDAISAVRQGLHCALRESSIVVDWLLENGGSNGWLRALTHRG